MEGKRHGGLTYPCKFAEGKPPTTAKKSVQEGRPSRLRSLPPIPRRRVSISNRIRP